MNYAFIFVLILLAVAAGYFYTKEPGSERTDVATERVSEESLTGDEDTDAAVNGGAFTTVAPGVQVAPISHASAVVEWGEVKIFADPVGDASVYQTYGQPDIVFITHRHGDHLDGENLPLLLSDSTTLIAPQDVVDQLPEGIAAKIVVMAAGETLEVSGLTFTAIPAYNIRPEAQNFHPRERGDNGYVIDDGTSRVYFSGDSEGTEEMKALTDIDAAFVAMNLPYTMSVEDAAAAVVAFAPATIYPYHYRTPDGFSDIASFTTLVHQANPDIEVVQLQWYPEAE